MDGGARCPWGRKELDTTERLHFSFSFLYSPTLTFILTTGKTIALTRWTFVGKVMSLLLNILSEKVKVKSLSRVQLFETPGGPGSSVHRIF